MTELKIHGVVRPADAPETLVLLFNRKPTDDELRFIHETIRARTPAASRTIQ